MKTGFWTTICLGLILFAGGYIVHTITEPLRWPGKVAKGVGHLLQVKTTITSNSVSLPAEDILELNLMQRQILCFTKQENSFRATRIIKGDYIAKAGYDLRDGYEITFDKSSRTIFIKLPKPKITSVEGIPETFHLDGRWEPNTKQNEAGNQQNKEQARQEAADSLTVEVDERMKERIRDIFGNFAAQIVFDSPMAEGPQNLLESPEL